MTALIEVEIDGQKVSVAPHSTIMDAARRLGIFVPHFCYHPKLSIAANCRMCLVEVEKAPKAVPACATPVSPGLRVKILSPKAVEAQRAVMGFLLINHPLDCPICDQGGECMLQDLAVGYGNSASYYNEGKRVVANKDLGPLIATDMTRCIHCTRCVRFGQEIAGVMELGLPHRGEHTEIMTFMQQAVTSELSGNVIDLCPVGALTSKPFRYSARSWELSRRFSISPHDSLGSNLLVQVKSGCVFRVLPFDNPDVNESWLSDRDRFSYEGLNAPSRLLTPRIRDKAGHWKNVDWETALSFVATELSRIHRQLPQNFLGCVAHPMSTTEELFVLRQLLTALGSASMDCRPARVDFRSPVTLQSLWLGMRIREIGTCDQILIIGSFLRNEQPLLAARIRVHAAQGTLSLHRLHVVDEDWHMPLKTGIHTQPSQLIYALAHIVCTVSQLTQQAIPDSIYQLVEKGGHCAAEDLKKYQDLAASLCSGRAVGIFLGSYASHHPDASILHYLAQTLSLLLKGTLGFFGSGANDVGGALVGAHARTHPLSVDHRCFFLFNVEPDYDVSQVERARSALRQADLVVNFTPYADVADDYSHVTLPIAPFSETEGTFVNMEGRVQTFRAVVKPSELVKPAWRILRVLAEKLALTGFEYDSCEQIRQQMPFLTALQQGDLSCLNNYFIEADVDVLPRLEKSDCEMIGFLPAYMSDCIVRRAPALQATVQSRVGYVGLSPEGAARLGVQTGDRLAVYQGEARVELPIEIIPGLTPESVLVPIHPGTRQFENRYGAVQLECVT